MPPKGRAPARRTTAKKATPDQGGDVELIERERSAAEASRVAAKGVVLQPIDGDGRPVGPAQHLGDMAVSVDPAQELTRIPLPTAVINEWFPAYFRPPGEDQPWATVKVYLTPQGLYVYRAAPDESETFTTGATPAWYSTVDFSKTAKPVTGYAAMNAGIPIETAAGRVNVQPYPGCGCGHRKLKNWTPSWSRNRISWTDAVALTDPTAGR